MKICTTEGILITEHSYRHTYYGTAIINYDLYTKLLPLFCMIFMRVLPTQAQLPPNMACKCNSRTANRLINLLIASSNNLIGIKIILTVNINTSPLQYMTSFGFTKNHCIDHLPPERQGMVVATELDELIVEIYLMWPQAHILLVGVLVRLEIDQYLLKLLPLYLLIPCTPRHVCDHGICPISINKYHAALSREGRTLPIVFYIQQYFLCPKI